MLILRVHIVALLKVFVFGIGVRQVVVFAFRAPSGAGISREETGQQGGQTGREHGRQNGLNGVALLGFVYYYVVVIGAFIMQTHAKFD